MCSLFDCVCIYKLHCFAQTSVNSACDANDSLVIVLSTDDGLYEETHGPENAIGGDLDADIDVRKNKVDEQGRLLGTTKGYTRLGGGGDAYRFEPDTRSIQARSLFRG